ncbi:ArdC family protein [Enterobacter hormaechei]|uniref:ArdC family protein n=1 Tax=Enterobacter hormaechei TaxID=158836 RepID=UPI00312C7A46
MTVNLYETITDKIIHQLEQGTRPWHKPWQDENASAGYKLPINATTGKEYRGINIPMLWLAVEEKAFTTNEWATFKQWEATKETVRKGEKGNMIVFYDIMEKENDKQEIETIPFLKTSYVLNRSQLKS